MSLPAGSANCQQEAQGILKVADGAACAGSPQPAQHVCIDEEGITQTLGKYSTSHAVEYHMTRIVKTTDQIILSLYNAHVIDLKQNRSQTCKKQVLDLETSRSLT